MKIVAIMPIKLKNERLPGKNTKILGNKPLMQYELDNLLKIEVLDSVNVYCSDEEVIPFLSKGVKFIKRPEYLDLSTSNFTQIFEKFMKTVHSDIYVYAHATATFISVDTMMQCIQAVKSGEYDSAFCATVIQDYLWKDGRPINFDANNIPRSQDLIPIYRETSGIYVYTKEVFQKYRRRIGIKPFIKQVSYKEAIDINSLDDFELAELLIINDIWK